MLAIRDIGKGKGQLRHGAGQRPQPADRGRQRRQVGQRPAPSSCSADFLRNDTPLTVTK